MRCFEEVISDARTLAQRAGDPALDQDLRELENVDGNERIEQLEQQVSDLNLDVDALEDDINDLETENRELRRKIEELKAELQLAKAVASP